MKLTKGKILKCLHKKRQSRKRQKAGSITSHDTKTMKRNIYVNLMRQSIKRRKNTTEIKDTTDNKDTYNKDEGINPVEEEKSI